MAICKYCGEDIEWQRTGGRWQPYSSGQPHQCKARASNVTVADRSTIDAEVKASVERAVEDIIVEFKVEQGQSLAEAVATVKEQAAQDVVRSREEALEYLREIKEQLPSIVDRAVRSLVPVEHKIVVERPDITLKLDGRPHKTLPELVDLVQLRQHVFLVGPAGSGKTTAAEQAATVVDLPFYARSMGPATTEWDLLGFRSPDGRYVPGVLRQPFECGGVLCLDEMDNTNPNVLTALNSTIANRVSSFPDGMVKRHPDFVCVAGGNTYGRGADRVYVGRMQLDGATLDRFGVLEWEYDEGAEMDWAGRDQVEWVEWVQGVRHKAQELRMRYIFSPRASIFGAQMLRAGKDRRVVEDVWLWKGIPEEDRERLRA